MKTQYQSSIQESDILKILYMRKFAKFIKVLLLCMAISITFIINDTIAKKDSVDKERQLPNKEIDNPVVKIDQKKPTIEELELTEAQLNSVMSYLKSTSEHAKLEQCSGLAKHALKVGEAISGKITLANFGNGRAMGKFALIIIGSEGIESKRYAAYDVPPQEYVIYEMQQGPPVVLPGQKAFVVRTNSEYKVCGINVSEESKDKKK